MSRHTLTAISYALPLLAALVAAYGVMAAAVARHRP